ncbi:MAG: sulfotransferase family 2 domain-containing protein, partial [Candidatus Thorarchaeota archaeon]
MVKNAVFIWIPKNAGKTIMNTVRRGGYKIPKKKTIKSIEEWNPQEGIITFGHVSYRQLVNKGYISKKFDGSSFKFCFSRNPYDRAVSLFFYLKKMGKLNSYADSSFLKFCKYLKEYGCIEIGLYNKEKLVQANPQVRWIEKIKIDFYGKVETIEKDLSKLLNTLDLSEVEKIPHLNKTGHTAYQDYY